MSGQWHAGKPLPDGFEWCITWAGRGHRRHIRKRGGYFTRCQYAADPVKISADVMEMQPCGICVPSMARLVRIGGDAR